MAAQAQAQPEPPAPVATRSDAGAKVVVACKLPNGLILRVFDETTVSLPMQHTGVMREFKEFHWDGDVAKQVTIFGTATPFGQAPKGLMIGGYALTPDVPKDLWDRWFKANQKSDIVRKHLIFAYEKAADAQDAALEHRAVRSGLEPLEPKDPGKTVPGIEKATVK